MNSLKNKLYCLFTSVALLFTTSVTSYASAFSDAMANPELKKILVDVSAVFNSIIILCLAAVILKVVLTRDAKVTSDAIAWGKRLIITFVVFNLLGSILTFANNSIVKDFAGNASYSETTFSDVVNTISPTT